MSYHLCQVAYSNAGGNAFFLRFFHRTDNNSNPAFVGGEQSSRFVVSTTRPRSNTAAAVNYDTDTVTGRRCNTSSPAPPACSALLCLPLLHYYPIRLQSRAVHIGPRVVLVDRAASSELNHLIMVPCHGVTVTESLEGADSRDADWFLLDYQKGKDVPRALVGHIEGGLDELDADPKSLLLFSGEFQNRYVPNTAAAMTDSLVKTTSTSSFSLSQNLTRRHHHPRQEPKIDRGKRGFAICPAPHSPHKNSLHRCIGKTDAKPRVLRC